MDARDEAGWILDKLTQQLQKELAVAAKERKEKSRTNSGEGTSGQSHVKTRAAESNS